MFLTKAISRKNNLSVKDISGRSLVHLRLMFLNSVFVV
ncbi:hypothetical protein PORCRE_1998 [Porphyromonas crevioricanis JCM 15906]|uniref:Uncharacterized protein n=1 Tax=Porphyromonas crevioricanis JCM 15906 TaxID=1305617 RepID=T1CJ55_9PORP|nr:hypothetical protein PORCRE_1998 [Porphyromonas crevioricanis JCM 15906]